MPTKLRHVVPDPTPLPTLTASITRLNLSVSTLTASHATKTASMATLAQEMQGHAKRETELRDMVGRAEDKRAFFMAFREWVESVAAFLDEKVRILSFSLMHTVYILIKAAVPTP